jgi:hypothetical protein
MLLKFKCIFSNTFDTNIMETFIPGSKHSSRLRFTVRIHIFKLTPIYLGRLEKKSNSKV